MRLRAHPVAGLRGRARVPGDKSISHRALLLGALAVGESRITGLLEGEDVLATAGALAALGVELEREAEGRWRVQGRGVGGFAEPDRPLDLGNSGTGARLLLGVLAGQPFTTLPDRRRLAAHAPDGPGDRAAHPDGRGVPGAQRPAPAARDHRPDRSAADPLPAAGRLGPGQVGDPAGRPARAGPDHGDRAGAVARPHRAPARASSAPGSRSRRSRTAAGR